MNVLLFIHVNVLMFLCYSGEFRYSLKNSYWRNDEITYCDRMGCHVQQTNQLNHTRHAECLMYVYNTLNEGHLGGHMRLLSNVCIVYCTEST